MIIQPKTVCLFRAKEFKQDGSRASDLGMGSATQGGWDKHEGFTFISYMIWASWGSHRERNSADSSGEGYWGQTPGPPEF